LHRYWIEFDEPGLPASLRRFGVTAFDIEDAMRLLRREVEALEVQRHRALADGSGMRVPAAPSRVVEDVDVTTLDAGHVRPNMHPPSERGVWFPKLRFFT
jgi:hypothetical protein